VPRSGSPKTKLFQASSADMPPSSPEHYEMDRVPGESEEDDQDRLRMFDAA
jgi:hypothetical protein